AAAAPSPQATTSRPTKKFNGCFSGQMLCLAGFIVLILKEFTVNKWRNPTGWLCAVAMPFALLLLSGCGSSDSLLDP
ncbi:hypothetical protein FYL88_24550, partial [Salmonella enterica subsp. enterica serovar Typhimurium]|nr:hypothetical protein [Salmonella enterica subsp. enterica]EBU6710700.1 hypothetical protein [Salmonella enterica subsp. enterica serovar Typhimurium]EBU8318406.1 hypothetical protein [Salmonella enterica subsp. enterica serovar Typhimurium]EBX4654569.1 hypothetical protein [Salmonella enterica subsp. enterica serovar Typhimurium]EBY2058095.1 hypothetical protein [Salmonella enterica subsp. enterica serovar Typhimurium]